MEPTHVTGKPRRWLRLDGAVVFVASILLFRLTHQHWWIYPLLLFVPDIFMLGYLRGTAIGAFLYNAGHTYLLPSLTILYGWHDDHVLVLAIGIIWLGHVGFDRFAGYGLKYDAGFKFTHLGTLFRLRDARKK
ncbi:MAG: DUF4260 domain-containing protein [Acidimicrobiales bacterium]